MRLLSSYCVLNESALMESDDLLQRGSEGVGAHAGGRWGSGGVVHRRQRFKLAPAGPWVNLQLLPVPGSSDMYSF
jgi:hypothetical protein